jgi:hypothetical protein
MCCCVVQVLCDGEAPAQQEALALMSDLVHAHRGTRTAALQVRWCVFGGVRVGCLGGERVGSEGSGATDE